MLRVGLTGGIGSGKSTVAELFAAHHVPIVDTDAIAHEVVRPGQPALADIAQQFGSDVLDQNGALDRAKMRQRVFDSPAEREKLERILHPRIRAEVQKRLDNLHTTYAVIVVPLLVETGFESMVDRVLVVDCDETIQIDRVRSRSSLSAEQVRRIMDAQASRQGRLARADDVIENNTDVENLKLKVAHLHKRYLELAKAG